MSNTGKTISISHEAYLEIKRLNEENAALTKKLNHIASMCGNPDPAEACRLIIKKCEEHV